MTTPVDAGGTPIFLTGDVTSDTPCRKCGYNVRGLPISGRCPECGTPVGVSVNGDLLRYSDPEYLETLRRGVHFILWGILAVIVLSIGAGVGQALRVSPAVVQLFVFAAAIPSIIGGWLLTVPDPGGIGEAQYGTARKIIRFSLIVGATNSLLNIPLAMASVGPATALAIKTIAFLAGIIGLVAQFAQLSYLRKLAMRIPDTSLSERAGFLMWAIAISYGAMIVFGFLAGVLGAGLGPGLAVFGCAAGIVGICLIVFAVMYLFMLGRFATRFREQAQLARQIWSSGGQLPTPEGPQVLQN